MLILCRYWVILVIFSNSHSPRSSFQAQLHRNPTVLGMYVVPYVFNGLMSVHVHTCTGNYVYCTHMCTHGTYMTCRGVQGYYIHMNVHTHIIPGTYIHHTCTAVV